ncbi:hypothetical protein [Anabaena sp. UHCC 0451]|uniref:hypothetical protein n=1 Tax=Anabaena sp. UHCC 0451 TaxID=2055235 RepID=UPI002B216710|nr:hypothetical protein [Anabaena sp. UHCC 0451]MEA5575926.1 hypothetical protein [Anabaena sp. UHCC 0451]
MSKQMIKSPPLVDLSIGEQQLFTGGQSNLMNFGKMPNLLSNGFPNVVGFKPDGSTGTNNTDEKIISHHNNVGTILY